MLLVTDQYSVYKKEKRRIWNVFETAAFLDLWSGETRRRLHISSMTTPAWIRSVFGHKSL